MRKYVRIVCGAFKVALLLGVLWNSRWATAAPAAGTNPSGNGQVPSVVLTAAPLIQMPGVPVPERKLLHAVDSNSPVHWDGDTMYMFDSYNHPYRLSGYNLEHLGIRERVRFNGLDDDLDIWIEATWKDPGGTLYGAYHYEPDTICFSNSHLPTAPRIGWIKSGNNGKTWQDLGFILDANPSAINCNSASPWDTGGTGDLVFLPDRKNEYFYIYGTSYDPRFAEQGVFVARMAFADRNNPSGKVMKWYQGSWSQPGLWGHVTPVFPAQKDYTHPDGEMFWGPSIHWNTYLKMYVMVLNHAINTRLKGGGVYISFNRRIGDPNGWSEPRMILDRAQVQNLTRGGSAQPNSLENGWYPEIIGTGKGESDKLCGQTGRLFVAGMSRMEITFVKPGGKQK
ncbi:MAG: hypothetical protein ACLQMO_11790 [Acidobacteriaceae bacterium]